MKSLILSVKPKHCANILNGLKTKEIRKYFPKDYRGWIYIYCTKEKPRAILTDKGCVVANTLAVGGNSQYKSGYSLSGKVVARFYCDNVEEINENYTYDFNHCVVDKRWYETKSLSANDLYEKSCLNRDDFDNYFRNKKTMKKCGYAIHISQLEIFDTPKELSDFYGLPKKMNTTFGSEMISVNLTKAPQSWCYCEVEQ